MYVCMCKGLTDGDIRRSVLQGRVACMDSLRETLGASTGCGCCEVVAKECLTEALDEKRRLEQTCRDNPARSSAQDESAPHQGFFPQAPQASYG